jgi:hypothetical protein
MKMYVDRMVAQCKKLGKVFPFKTLFNIRNSKKSKISENKPFSIKVRLMTILKENMSKPGKNIKTQPKES